MRPFSFIHAADLHIDSPFCGVTAKAPEIAKALQASTFRAFENLIDTCIDRQVDFLLIAGDVYDAQDRSLRAQLRFRDGLVRLEKTGIRAYVVHGNHDPLEGQVNAIGWPKTVHFFGKRLESVVVHAGDEPLACLSGVSFPIQKVMKNLAKGFKRSTSDLFHIGLLHCNVDANAEHGRYAPCELRDLHDAGMDYWALGHVHTRKVLSETPWVVYPGNIQGRSICEQGSRGCCHVEVDDQGRAHCEFVPLDVVRWSMGHVSINDLATMDALERALFEKVEALLAAAENRGLICRIEIKGRGSLYRELRAERAAEVLLERIREGFEGRDPFIWVQGIKVDCRPTVDLIDRAREKDLLAEVLTISREIKEQSEGLAALYTEVLAECWEHKRLDKTMNTPSEEQLKELLSEAEMLCLDLLEGDA